MARSIQEIQADLEALEQDDTLYEEPSFGRRLEALDAIEVSILACVEGLRAVHGQAEALVTLEARAETALRRLEAIDDRLFHRLREDIRSGILRGPALRHRLETYAGPGRGKRSQSGGSYDSLDALLSGVLLVKAVPVESTEREPEMVFYQPTPARIIFELVESASFQKHDTFYDLGSGLGQVVTLVHLLSGVTAKGVEVDPAYCEYARQCAQDLNLPGVGFVNADAREADVGDGTVFFLYTPFEGRILQHVLERLREEAETRTIGVYTYGPCTFEVSRQSWLRAVDRTAPHVDRLAAFRSVGTDSQE